MRDHYVKQPEYDQEAMDNLLWRSKHETYAKQKNRYDAVILWLEGRPRKSISEVLHTPLRTVSAHILAYQSGGIDALAIKKQPGAKRKLTEAQEQELYSIISSQTPEEAGVGIFANWTLDIIRKLIEQKYDVSYSFQGVHVLVHRLGLSYTRPTYVLKKAAPEKQVGFLEKWEALKKTPP